MTRQQARRAELDQHIGTWNHTPTTDSISLPAWVDPATPRPPFPCAPLDTGQLLVSHYGETLTYRHRIDAVTGTPELDSGDSELTITVRSDVAVELVDLRARFRHHPPVIDLNGLGLTPAAALDLADALQRAVVVAAGPAALIQWHTAMADDDERADPDGELDPQDSARCPRCQGTAGVPGPTGWNAEDGTMWCQNSFHAVPMQGLKPGVTIASTNTGCPRCYGTGVTIDHQPCDHAELDADDTEAERRAAVVAETRAAERPDPRPRGLPPTAAHPRPLTPRCPVDFRHNVTWRPGGGVSAAGWWCDIDGYLPDDEPDRREPGESLGAQPADDDPTGEVPS